MRRTSTLALTAALTPLLVLGLAACGQSTGGATADAQPESGPVTISYGIWDKNQMPAMQKIADEFHVANPNVTVKIQVTPFKQYFTTLQTAAAGGGAPDVFWMNGPNVACMPPTSNLLPLDQTISRAKARPREVPRGARRPLHLRRQDVRHPEGLRHDRRLVQQGALRREEGSPTPRTTGRGPTSSPPPAPSPTGPRASTARPHRSRTRPASTTRSPRPVARSSTPRAPRAASTPRRRSRASSSGPRSSRTARRRRSSR